MFPKNLFKKPNVALEGVKKAASEAFVKCLGCGGMLPVEELKASLQICPRCGAYLRMGARERVRMLADEESFEETGAGIAAKNPLAFPGYEEKLETARRESGETEAVLTGFCTIGGLSAGLFCMEPRFMMGSMGTAVGEKLALLFEEAARRKLPVVGTVVSGGARVQEGVLSLLQMAKLTGAVERHGNAGLAYFPVLTDPTTGGVEASFAMLGDIILAEPGALIGFAGPRVIEQTIRQRLPQGFQRAEFQLEKGFIDAIVPRREMKSALARLIALNAGEGGAHERV